LKGIYQIKNTLTNTVYIGSSIDIEKRTQTHIRDLNNKTHINSDLQKDWTTYGSSAFVFEVIEEVDKDWDLPEKEYCAIISVANNNQIYNKSNPLHEPTVSRYKDKYKVKNKKPRSQYKYTQKQILEILVTNFNCKMSDLHTFLDTATYYEKSKVDNYIKSRLDADLLADERLDGLLVKYYNKEKLVVLKNPYSKKALMKFCNLKEFPLRDIIITRKLNYKLGSSHNK
jgi:GIY-YIG catalytic domain